MKNKICGKCKHYTTMCDKGFCVVVECEAGYYDYACQLSYLPRKVAKATLNAMQKRIEKEIGSQIVINPAPDTDKYENMKGD